MATFSVMEDVPNPLFDLKGDPFSGAVLKAFLPGTTTSISIAIDSAGGSPQTSITANAEGKWEVSGNEILPYIDQKHKWGVFANATDAAANTPFYMGPFNNVEVGVASSTYDQGGTGAVSRTVENRLRDLISVADFGTGNNVAQFQAAIDSTTDGEIQTILVPAGSYAGDFSTLTVGTRTVVLVEQGDVTYTGTQPTINRVYGKFGSDITRPWFIGKNGFISDQTTGASNDRPVLRAQRIADHTGGTAGANASAISADVTVNQTAGRVDNFENAYVGSVTSFRSDIVTGVPNMAVYQGTLFKKNPSKGGFFGANFVARDETTRQSSVSLGGLVSTECTLVASGPDNSNLRVVIDAVARGYDNSADGATSVFAGIRVRPSNTGVVSSEPVQLEHGILVDEGTLGTVANCIQTNGGGTGLRAVGTYTNHAIEIDTTTLASVKIGSDVKTVGNVAAQILLAGNNASDATVTYGNVRVVPTVNTAGSESGRIDIRTLVAGTETTIMLFDGNQANSIQLRVNSTLKQVSEGAANSGDPGFRVLQVVN